MSDWRDAILKDFVKDVSKVTVVEDPDSLLAEEKLALSLRQRGFDLISFGDPVEFRYVYESQYRSQWDQGRGADLVVALQAPGATRESLPYDLFCGQRFLAVGLGKLFPNLSYPVVEKLDKGLLDDLYAAQSQAAPDPMGDNATMDFILLHVFGIAAALIRTDVDLLRALLRLHYGQLPLPPMLAGRLVQALAHAPVFKDWPLVEIVPDAGTFFAFLQERWPLFLRKNGGDGGGAPAALRYRGPGLLPFDHQDVRVYVDNLFVEGKLAPVAAGGLALDDGAWERCGTVGGGAGADEQRASRLFALVREALPPADARHAEWAAFALKWAELSSLVHGLGSAGLEKRLREAGAAIDQRFAGWLGDHYSGLVNLPPNDPAMVHQVPRRLARALEGDAGARVALVVVDGLALDQWVTIRQHLQGQVPDLAIAEAATFAWVPTLTSVSRQAIFAGRPPLCFPASIDTTNAEEKEWKQFWEGQGLSKPEVAYRRGLGDGDAAQVVQEVAKSRKVRAVGLVVDKVDKIMHGMQLGAPGMHNQIKQWCAKGFLAALIDGLLGAGYEVWLTSDHGNLECEGGGRPKEGALAETRGERARIYPTPELRERVAGDFAFAAAWPPHGLPEGYFPLVATGRAAFVAQGEVIVGHGGAAIEEVIVPLARFSRRAP